MAKPLKPLTRNGNLAEHARHVILPAGIASTGWPAVRDTCASFGIGFDGWQDGAGRAILAKNRHGIYATSTGGVVLSIPRQVGKTYLIGWIVFALCIIVPCLTVIWTAHRSRTADETFESMKAMAKTPKVAGHILDTPSGAGSQAVRFTNGSRILFGAREQGFGRGFQSVGIVVFDEAQILTEKAINDMVPAQNAVENALTFMIGTPPQPTDPSEVFVNRRREALDGQATDTLYIEFSADEDAHVDDRDQWRKANPSYPHRTSETAMKRMRSNLTDESFRREGLGIWDRDAGHTQAIKKTAWEVLSTTEAPTDGVKCYGVRFSADGSTVALAGALKPADGPNYLEGIRAEPTGAGIRWLVDFFADRHQEAAQIVIDGKAGIGYLVQALRDEGVAARVIITPTIDQVIAAHTMLEEGIRTGAVVHGGEELLTEQATTALKRPIGRDGGFGWAAPEGGSVVLLEATTLANWAASTTKRRPGRKARFL